jgi:GT2 family glycosyltransferase
MRLRNDPGETLTVSPEAVTVSVVSHAQGALVQALLEDLARSCAGRLRVILTVNIPERLPFSEGDFPFPLAIVRNERRRGFGANHNAAFSRAQSPYFCVVNPDVRIVSDPFPALVAALSDPGVAIAAPLVRNPAGGIEDSARRFPTLPALLSKLLARGSRPDYAVAGAPVEPDWVAGMFMLLRADAFARLQGFDERYFMYYEDVDLCARAGALGLRVVLDPRAQVVHDARRASHRSPRHAWWHVRSIVRFLTGPHAVQDAGRAQRMDR